MTYSEGDGGDIEEEQLMEITTFALPTRRGERLLQTHTLVGQEVQLPSFDRKRATELYLLSNQNMS